jgi:hypothetical protein
MELPAGTAKRALYIADKQDVARALGNIRKVDGRDPVFPWAQGSVDGSLVHAPTRGHAIGSWKCRLKDAHWGANAYEESKSCMKCWCGQPVEHAKLMSKCRQPFI